MKKSVVTLDSEGEVNAISYTNLQASDMLSSQGSKAPPRPVVEARNDGHGKLTMNPESTSSAAQRSRNLEFNDGVRSRPSVTNDRIYSHLAFYSALVRFIEFMLRHSRSVAGDVGLQVLALLQEQLHHRDISSAIMDIVIVIYALGFIALSVYHASMFKT